MAKMATVMSRCSYFKTFPSIYKNPMQDEYTVYIVEKKSFGHGQVFRVQKCKTNPNYRELQNCDELLDLLCRQSGSNKRIEDEIMWKGSVLYIDRIFFEDGSGDNHIARIPKNPIHAMVMTEMATVLSRFSDFKAY